MHLTNNYLIKAQLTLNSTMHVLYFIATILTLIAFLFFKKPPCNQLGRPSVEDVHFSNSYELFVSLYFCTHLMHQCCDISSMLLSAIKRSLDWSVRQYSQCKISCTLSVKMGGRTKFFQNFHRQK